MHDFLDVEALRDGAGGGLWTSIDVVDEVSSTNAELAARSRRGARAGSVLVTGYQNAGRGRFDRAWQAPPRRAIALSASVRPQRPLRDWGWLPLLAGVAVCDGLRQAAGLEAVLKWPNDVLVAGRKICGILCEAVPAEGGHAAIIGLGINVSQTAGELPVPGATSVRLEGSDASATAVAAATLRALEDAYRHWDGGDSPRERYRGRCSTIGQHVAVHVPSDRRILGRAVDVDDAGCLVVETAEGRRTFSAGDVVHLRRG